jgi:hypothetical protein
MSAGSRPVAGRRCRRQVLRRGLGPRSRGLRSLRRWRRELGRGKALRLSRGLGLRLRLSMGAARRHRLSLRQCLGRGLRQCLGRGLCHRLGTGGRLGLRGYLSRGLLSTGRLSLPRILGLRGQSMGDGCRLGGNLRRLREPGPGRSLGLRSDLVR